MKCQSEMKTEVDRFFRERKELSEQIQEVESQLEWLRSERDDEMAKLSAEKKVLQDRLHDAETQLSQLRSRKRDELKVCIYTILHICAFLTEELMGLSINLVEICEKGVCVYTCTHLETDILVLDHFLRHRRYTVKC